MENTHFTHLYIHNIHKLEPIQAGLDADLWESRHKIGSDSILSVTSKIFSGENGGGWGRKKQTGGLCFIHLRGVYSADERMWTLWSVFFFILGTNVT